MLQGVIREVHLQKRYLMFPASLHRESIVVTANPYCLCKHLAANDK